MGRPTSADQGTAERSIAITAASPPYSSSLGGSKPWLAVIIQATLVEMGCERVAISGQWDAATHEAAERALTVASYETAIAATPSDELLLTLRQIRGRACAVASVGKEGRQKPNSTDEVSGVMGVKADPESVVRNPTVSPRMRLGADPHNATKPKNTQSAGVIRHDGHRDRRCLSVRSVLATSDGLRSLIICLRWDAHASHLDVHVRSFLATR